MQQVKIFKSVETEVRTLEADVNAWLRETGARVLSITGNIAPQSERVGSAEGGKEEIRFFPSDVLLVVLYEVPVG
jgi:hypothetical protein